MLALNPAYYFCYLYLKFLFCQYQRNSWKISLSSFSLPFTPFLHFNCFLCVLHPHQSTKRSFPFQNAASPILWLLGHPLSPSTHPQYPSSMQNLVQIRHQVSTCWIEFLNVWVLYLMLVKGPLLLLLTCFLFRGENPFWPNETSDKPKMTEI